MLEGCPRVEPDSFFGGVEGDELFPLPVDWPDSDESLLEDEDFCDRLSGEVFSRDMLLGDLLSGDLVARLPSPDWGDLSEPGFGSLGRAWELPF